MNYSKCHVNFPISRHIHITAIECIFTKRKACIIPDNRVKPDRTIHALALCVYFYITYISILITCI